jgi:hypothetical protein
METKALVSMIGKAKTGRRNLRVWLTLEPTMRRAVRLAAVSLTGRLVARRLAIGVIFLLTDLKAYASERSLRRTHVGGIGVGRRSGAYGRSTFAPAGFPLAAAGC